MKYKIIYLVLLLFGCASLISAQDETPTAVTVQNRTGDLPFSQTVGTGAEHVDIGSGNLIVDVPIISLPGRHMPFNYGLRYNALFWTVASRTQANGSLRYFWKIERRPYLGGIDQGLGFTPTLPQLSWGVSQEVCDNLGGIVFPSGREPGTDNSTMSTARDYIYTDAGGGKHPLGIVQYSVTSPDGGCFTGFQGASQLQNFAPTEGIRAVAPDIYSTPAIYLPDGTQVAWPTDNSILTQPLNPDFWYPISFGQYVDANGNSKCEPGICNTLDTLGRNPLTIVNGSNQILYKVNDSDGVQRTYTVNLGTISVNTNFGLSGVAETSQTRTVVTSIVLPNGTAYSFQYEPGSYGGLTSVTLPTGATISYTWATLSPPGNATFTHRYVSGRTATVGTKTFTWAFNKTCSDSDCLTVNTDVTDPQGNHTVYQHTDGKVVSAKTYSGAVGSTPLRQYAVDYNPLLPDPNALPSGITTTLKNGLHSKVEYDYDTTGGIPGNVSEIREYGYDGGLIRRTHNVYGLNTNSAYLALNIVDKVTQQSIYDSASDTCKGVAGACAQTQYEYDNYVANDNSLQSTSSTSAPQHDYTGYGSSFTLRGNATRVKRWSNTDSAWLTTTYSYDDLGNIRAIKDPLGHVTSYDYGDSFYDSHCPPPSGTNAQAYVTQVTNAKSQHIQLTRYSCTGLVQAHKDQNDIDATLAGTTQTFDLMNRPLITTFVNGGHVTMDYHGDALPLKSTKTTNITSGLDLVVSSLTDGLGRTVQTTLDSDPEGVDYTDTNYDVFGQVTVSNPYRSTSDPTYGVTTTLYDALGRAYQTTRQDGSVSAVSYTGNCVTTTDEAGNQRKSCSDALGRITEVDEPAATAGTAASGSLTISGTLQSNQATSGTPGTGSVTLSGGEQSKAGTPATAATATITITGSERSTLVCAFFLEDGTCGQWTTFYDNGNVSISVNGHVDSVFFDQGSTSVNVAAGLATAINNDGSAFVNASAANGVLSLTARQAGTVGNGYSWSLSSTTNDPTNFGSAGSFAGSPAFGTMSGGTNAGPTVYDHGSCTVTINGTAYSKSYGQTDTPTSIASGLATTISSGTLASASASGATISLTAKTSGASTNYSLTSSISCSYDSANFSNASFTTSTSGSALTGGANGSPAVTDAGTVQVSVGGYTATANYGNGTGQDATGPAVAADLVGKIQAQLPTSNPPFAISASSATVNISWGSVGVAGNVNVTTTSTTTQSATFPRPSFAGCSISTNPQTCTTVLSGGADPTLPSLSTPWVTLYQYDALGNLLRVDQKGSAPNDSTQWRTRTFTYDSLSRLLTANNPESGTINYSYDDDGNLLQKNSPAHNQTGTAMQTVSYCYDELHRVTFRDYSPHTYNPPACPITAPVVSYFYDSGTSAKGHLTSLTDQAGTASYTYNTMGRLTAETRTLTSAAIPKTLSYDYNLDGSLYKLHYPSGNVVTYTQAANGSNSAGRIGLVQDQNNNINYVTGAGTSSYATYSPDGAPTSFLSGNSGTFAGITNAFSYNKRLQPINMSANAPSQTVFSIGYDFHVGNGTSGADNGNVFGITNYKDQTRNQAFTYDALNRLASARNAGTDCTATVLGGLKKFWGNNYTYDAWGNLIGKSLLQTPPPAACAGENLSVTADAHNLIHASDTDYQYDAAGNMTFNATPPTQNYSYDQENRLTGAAGSTYTYDADGNRVIKSNGSTGTLYWYMTPGIVGESDLNGNLTDEYVFFGGERVARKSTNGVFYYFSDHLKTASVITDSAGNIKAESDYYPWGGELQFVANDSNHYKFTGKERDGETQLDYFGARYYSNGLGRWVSADWSPTPIPVPYADFGDPQSLNLYTYVRNIPTTSFDAAGHCDDGWLCDIGKGFVVGLQRANELTRKFSDAANRLVGFNPSRPGGDAETAETGRGIEPQPDLSTENKTQEVVASTTAIVVPALIPGEEETAVLGAVERYEVGTYGELSSRSVVGDGLVLDHIPSNASNIARAESELGRPLSAAERAAVRDQGTAVAVPDPAHRSASPTFGGRNTAAQIQGDAANPQAAAARDSQAMVSAASAGDKVKAQEAAAKICQAAGCK